MHKCDKCGTILKEAEMPVYLTYTGTAYHTDAIMHGYICAKCLQFWPDNYIFQDQEFKNVKGD